MLVLQRAISETILIGDDIRITLVSIRGQRARLGITAPRHIRVLREEIAETPVLLNRIDQMDEPYLTRVP